MENKSLIEKAIAFIQANPKENLTLQSIADNAGFSLAYFDAIFRKHTGYTPVEYSRIYRLTRSALELRRSNRSVLDIALEFGYLSPEAYTRAFKGYYGITPSRYRAEYAKRSVTWHDLSGKISIGHFEKCYPKLKKVDTGTAIDYCFTHNRLLFAEDIIGMSIGDVVVFTLGDPCDPEHFIYVSDYNEAEAFVNFVCTQEAHAIEYLKHLSAAERFRFTIRKPADEEWENFDSEAAKLGLTCRVGYDMVCLDSSEITESNEWICIRELSAEDMPLVRAFCAKGGCGENHVKGLQVALEGRGNLGERGFAVLVNGEITCLATPILDEIRDLKKYDIGAVFTLRGATRVAEIEAIWRHIIAVCHSEDAILSNAYAYDDDSSVGIAMSERVGLIKIAKVCNYSR